LFSLLYGTLWVIISATAWLVVTTSTISQAAIKISAALACDFSLDPLIYRLNNC
jgi:hypothetical protein